MDNFDLRKYLTENKLLTEKSVNQKTRDYVENWSLAALGERLEELYREMEQEAEPEGCPVVDQYADEITSVEDAIRIKKGTFGNKRTYDDVFPKKSKSSFWDEGNLDLFEAQIFKVDWENFTDDEKETALLSVIKDPDDPRIDEFLFSEWDDLPDWVQDQMQIDRDDERADYTEDDWENFYLDADLPEGINEADIDKIASEWTVPELEEKLLDLEIEKEEGKNVDAEIKKYENAIKILKSIKKYKGTGGATKTSPVTKDDEDDDNKNLSPHQRLKAGEKKREEEEFKKWKKDKENKGKDKKDFKKEKEGKKEKVKETIDGFDLRKFISEGNLHKKNIDEITQRGQEGVYPISEEPGDMFQQKEVEELFPIAFAMKDNKDFKDRLAQHADWTEDSMYNNTFVHFQYHNMEDVNGNDYFVHQSQHYNHNYDDFRSPKFTKLSITKNYEKDNEEDLGEYIVGTGEYLDDIKNLEAQGINMKRSMEEGKQRLNEDRWIVMWRTKDTDYLKKKGFDPEYPAFAPEAVTKGGWKEGREFMVSYGDFETPRDRAKAHAEKNRKEDGETMEYGVHLKRDNVRFEENVNEIISNPSKIDILIDNLSKSTGSEIKQYGQDVFGIVPQDFGEDADEIYSHIVDEILPLADDEEIDEYFETYFGGYADEVWAGHQND